MVKIPPLFELILPGANPSRREFLRRGVQSVVETKPEQMDSMELLQYLGNMTPGAREDEKGLSTWWALDTALWNSGASPEAYARAEELLGRLAPGGVFDPDVLSEILPIVDEALPRFRQHYLDYQSKHMQGQLERRQATRDWRDDF